MWALLIFDCVFIFGSISSDLGLMLEIVAGIVAILAGFGDLGRICDCGRHLVILARCL